MKKFNSKTFQYFSLAQKNKNNRQWFEKNKSLYEENVRGPFTDLISEIQKELQDQLPHISISPRSLTRPLRPKNRAQTNGIIRNSAYISLAEPRSSLFEWNPGIYIQVGNNAEDNFLGIGLYMVSSRQLSLLRNALAEDFEEIDALVSDKKFKKSWGELKGDKYKRFPKGFNPDDPRNQYLWYKQFFVGRRLSKKEIQSPQFIAKTVHDLEVAMPFFQWIRKNVGTYRKQRAQD